MPSSIELIPNLNKTGSKVYHLVKQLPQEHAFNIYMNNFFSSINLDQFFHEKGFGACETVRTNTTRFLIDNSPVMMLTAIHKIDKQDKSISIVAEPELYYFYSSLVEITIITQICLKVINVLIIN
ncbi:11024_t:CDS:2, partial [Cetraspora pellucida]